MGETDNGWAEYKREVLGELRSLNIRMVSIQTDVVELKVELAKQQVKAGMWGMISGSMSGVGVIIIALFIYWIKTGS